MYGIQYGYFTIAFIIGLTYSTSEAHPGGRKGRCCFNGFKAMPHCVISGLTYSTSEPHPGGRKGLF